MTRDQWEVLYLHGPIIFCFAFLLVVGGSSVWHPFRTWRYNRREMRRWQAEADAMRHAARMGGAYRRYH